MKAYQIVDKNNPISVEYAALSKASFQPAIDAGIITSIEEYQCVTPDDPDFYEKCAQYTWYRSQDVWNDGQEFSYTDKARMITHFELWAKQRVEMNRFFIMEHDAFLREGHADSLAELCANFIGETGSFYANLGLSNCFYSITPHFGGWAVKLLKDQNFPINTMISGTTARIFNTYCEHYLDERNYYGRDYTVVCAWKDGEGLGMGRNIYDIIKNDDPDTRYNPRIPVTQVVKKSLHTTVENNYLQPTDNDEPWTRSGILHVID